MFTNIYHGSSALSYSKFSVLFSVFSFKLQQIHVVYTDVQLQLTMLLAFNGVFCLFFLCLFVFLLKCLCLCLLKK